MKWLNVVLLAGVSLTMLAGCVSEEERRAMAAQEKARQEQIAQEARAKRERMLKEAKERKERAAKEAKEREERLAKEKIEQEKKTREEAMAQRKKRIEDAWAQSAELDFKRVMGCYKGKIHQLYGGNDVLDKGVLKSPFRIQWGKEDSKEERKAKEAQRDEKRKARHDAMKAFNESIKSLPNDEKRVKLKEYIERQSLAEENEKHQGDWIKDWVGPRLDISAEESEKGEELLNAFASKLLPKAYETYKNSRAAAMQMQKVFNENFPQPWRLKDTDPEWEGFSKFLKKFAVTRMAYFRRRDELCHLYVLNKVGAITLEEVRKLDDPALILDLCGENTFRLKFPEIKLANVDEALLEFAGKMANKSYVTYKKLVDEFEKTKGLLTETIVDMRTLDYVRYDVGAFACYEKQRLAKQIIDKLVYELRKLHSEFKLMEKDATAVSKVDQELELKNKASLDLVCGFISQYVKTPWMDMVEIPGADYMIGRTEVTQIQWLSVMGCNPFVNDETGFYGYRLHRIDYMKPIMNMTWDEAQEFIKRLNDMNIGAGINRRYRLPTEAEWTLACKAGSSTGAGKRQNGEEGPIRLMGWYGANSDYNETYRVAQKEPNAFGLFDMHGNVMELCTDTDGNYHITCGGSCGWKERNCLADRHERHLKIGSDDRGDNVGIRLISTK